MTEQQCKAKFGVKLTFMGEVPYIGRGHRRNGNVYKTPQGYFLYIKKGWHKMVFDKENSRFTPFTDDSVSAYKWED